MEKIKKNWSLILIALGTVALGVIAVVTAVKLYKVGRKPIAPTAPLPAPAAELQCKLTFTVSEITGTPTPTGVISGTPTPTGRVTVTPTPSGGVTTTPTITTTPQPTPTPITSCYNDCSSSSDCRSGLVCQQVRGVGDKKCLNTQCETESDCVCNKHCWDICGHDSECPADHSCVQIGTLKRCVRYQPCTTETQCCGLVAATVTPTTYVAKVTVPEAGFIPPTLLMLGGGIGAVVASLLLLAF